MMKSILYPSLLHRPSPANTRIHSNKRVRFDRSVVINGSEQVRMRQIAALRIIGDDRYENTLVALDGDSRAVLNVIIAVQPINPNGNNNDKVQGGPGNPNGNNNNGNDQDENQEDREFRRKLQQFRNTVDTMSPNVLDTMSPNKLKFVSLLVGLDGDNNFGKKFKQKMPSTVISSNESSPNHHRRDQEQQNENDLAELFQFAGPEDNNGVPPQQIPLFIQPGQGEEVVAENLAEEAEDAHYRGDDDEEEKGGGDGDDDEEEEE